MFLLRPDAVTNNAFAYCLAEAAQRFGIDVLLPMAESNHHHTVIFHRHATCRCCSSTSTRCSRAASMRAGVGGRTCGPPKSPAFDQDTVMDKLVYAATNPVKRQPGGASDGVARHQRLSPPGRGQKSCTQIDRVTSSAPTASLLAEVTLRLVIPPELGPADEVIAELKARVAEVEDQMRGERARTGRRVVGCRRILAQSWRESPTSIAPCRVLRPRFAGRIAARVAALLGFREFLALYREARRRLLAGLPAVFPAGTHWLSRFAAVPAPLPART